MMKATFVNPKTKRTVLMIGLSFANLDKFRSAPLDTFIKIDGAAVGLPIDIMIISGATEAAMADYLAPSIGSDTKVYVDPKLKS